MNEHYEDEEAIEHLYQKMLKNEKFMKTNEYYSHLTDQ